MDLFLCVIRTQMQLQQSLRHFILMTSCRTEIETVSQMEKAGPFDSCCSHHSVASPSLCLCRGSRWTFWAQ